MHVLSKVPSPASPHHARQEAGVPEEEAHRQDSKMREAQLLPEAAMDIQTAVIAGDESMEDGQLHKAVHMSCTLYAALFAMTTCQSHLAWPVSTVSIIML